VSRECHNLLQSSRGGVQCVVLRVDIGPHGEGRIGLPCLVGGRYPACRARSTYVDAIRDLAAENGIKSVQTNAPGATVVDKNRLVPSPVWRHVWSVQLARRVLDHGFGVHLAPRRDDVQRVGPQLIPRSVGRVGDVEPAGCVNRVSKLACSD
jgi:hypothetical protein